MSTPEIICHLLKQYRGGLKLNCSETAHKSFLGSENNLFEFTLNFLFDRSDLNQRIASLGKHKHSILLIRISCQMFF